MTSLASLSVGRGRDRQRWSVACPGHLFAYADNYLIDLKCAVILDVEPTTAVRQAEVTAAKTMIARTAERLGIEPARLAADTGYGSAEMLAWLVEERRIEPHIPVFDKSARKDGSCPVPISPTTTQAIPMPALGASC